MSMLHSMLYLNVTLRSVAFNCYTGGWLGEVGGGVVSKCYNRGHYIEADLSHELLGGEDQLIVDKPAWVFLEEAGVGVNHHRLLVLHRLVLPAFTQSGGVVKIARCDRLVTAMHS